MAQAPRQRIVIVGGGQAGGRLAQLLAADDRCEITLVAREPHPPYERPPLSKGLLLGTATFETCLVWRGADDAWTRVERRLGVAADAIEREAKAIRLANGERLHYDQLVLATGSSARRLICPGSDLAAIHRLRSIDDALAIGAHFAEGKRLVIVGGGFIGLEVAACARAGGLDVTVVEASDRLLGRVVPPEIAGLLAERHAAEGVALKMRTMVERFIGDGRGAVKAVELSCGQTLPCDLAVVGIGAEPETALARSAGLDVEVGIRVDASLRTSDPSILACGDAATFWHPLFEQHVRLEAWQNAEDHARVAAGVLSGMPAICESVPWFWSDQYDLALQITGLPHLGSSTVTRRLHDGAAILFHLGPTGRIFGATGLGAPDSIGRDMRLAQALIAARKHPDPAGLRDPDARLKSMLRPSAAPLSRYAEAAAG
jgi:3-phenylpropionate/trans-cinnamate dioxygenase ferredoxin reductase subunit